MSAMLANRKLAVLLGLIGISPVLRMAHAGGVPEPGITMYGQILAYNGSLVTQGRLTWTFMPDDGTPLQVTVTTDLAPIVDASGTTYSYCLHIPAEMPAGSQPLTPNCLPATQAPVVYRREATLDGGSTEIVPDSLSRTTFALGERGKIERVDLHSGLFGPPDVPSRPSPADGQLLVPLDVTLDWANTARALTYDVFLWQAVYGKPPTPTAVGLTSSQFLPPTLLRPHTVYAWQVIARNSEGATAGPEWTFRTVFQGDLQKILEYLLGKRDLSFVERRALDLNGDGDLDIADFVMGLNYTRYYSWNPETPIRDLVEKESPPIQPTAPPGPKSIFIQSEWVDNNVVTLLTLPLYVAPNVSGVAGMNLHLEMNPMQIQMLQVRPTRSNSNECLYSHSPYPGVTNIVFFADPVRSLQGDTSSTLLLDIRAMLPRPVYYSEIKLKSGVLSDTTGVALTDVQKAGGMLIVLYRLDASHWELYR